MPNIATVFKDEIARVARKELRKLIDPLRKQITAQRRDIAALKRDRDELQRKLASLGKTMTRATGADAETAETTETGSRHRFSAQGLRSMRGKLGLSAADMGRLVGVTGQSIYNWEQGKSRPRQTQVQAIAQLRGRGKRQVKRLLAESE